MGFIIGDKVKFVNEIGGGIITKFLSSSRVQVAIEDGFEIPYQISELIKVDNPDDNSSLFYNKSSSSSDNISVNKDTNTKIEDESHLLKKGYLLSKEIPGVYLAFVPVNQKLLASAKLDIFLVNHTEADILFSVFALNENNDFTGIEYGIADSESKIYIDTVEREDINIWEHVFIQLIYYCDNKILAPFSQDFKIKSIRFSKEDSYITSAFFDEEKAFVININVYNDQPVITQAEDESYEYNNEIIQPLIEEEKKEDENTLTFIHKNMTDEQTAEIDMHIWELVEDYTNLKPNDIFKIQMKYFNKCLESALINKLSRVVFIHGVGNGSLKKEIRDKLEEEYPEIKVYDASIAQYGIGATEITIPRNLKMI